MLTMDQLGERLEAFFGDGIDIDLREQNQAILQGDGFWIRFEREVGYAPWPEQGGGYYAHLWIELLPDSGYFTHPHVDELNRFARRYGFKFADYPSSCMMGGGEGRGRGPHWPLMFEGPREELSTNTIWWEFPPGVYRIKLFLTTAYRLLKD